MRSWPSSTNGSGTSCPSGEIRRVEPFSIERRQNDRVEFDRIAFKFAKHGYGDLRALIDALNDYTLTAG